MHRWPRCSGSGSARRDDDRYSTLKIAGASSWPAFAHGQPGGRAGWKAIDPDPNSSPVDTGAIDGDLLPAELPLIAQADVGQHRPGNDAGCFGLMPSTRARASVPSDRRPPKNPPGSSKAPRHTYGEDDLIGAAEGVFGKGAKGLRTDQELLSQDRANPMPISLGAKAGGALVVGARYGSGTLYHKVEGNGPSIGPARRSALMRAPTRATPLCWFTTFTTARSCTSGILRAKARPM